MFRRRIILFAVMGIAACDLPTQPPRWVQTWAVEAPGEGMQLSVAELLPADVDLNADSTAFEATVPSVSMELTLGEMCGTCPDGLTVPKPAFEATLASTTNLPADLLSASLTGGAFDLVMEHSFDFDPLRPNSDPAQPKGFLVISITSDGNVVARDTIHGDDTAFPNTVTLTPSLPVRTTSVANNLDVEVLLNSPEGDLVTIDNSQSLAVTLSPSVVEIAEATVTASGMEVAGAPTTLNFEGVDSALVGRIQSGSLVLETVNEFGVTGTLGLTFQTESSTINKGIAVQTGTFTETVDFTGDELREILGGEVQLTTDGTLSTAAGTVTITPTQQFLMEMRFDLDVLIGSEEEDA